MKKILTSLNGKGESNKTRGGILIQVIAFTAIGLLLLSSLVTWSIVSIRLARVAVEKEQAFQIAEAGIVYYRWHLAHDPMDFTDGMGVPGPYVHPFYNKNGIQIGTYSLNITPPPLGSTEVIITSTGSVLANPNAKRTLQARFGKPSLAKYAVLANDFMYFGPGTEVFGPVHSNGAIRFDGLAHNLFSSSQTTHNDPTHADPNLEYGVHTHVNAAPATGISAGFRPQEAPPTVMETRPDVFQVGRQISVPAVDFSGISSNMAQIKTDAIASGVYYAASGAQGYRIVLKVNDTFDIYRVNTLLAPPGGCTNVQGETGWGTWSISTAGGAQTLVASNVPFPANGLIFVEDYLWVEGKIDTARLTIAAGTFPDNVATRKSITVNENLLYTNYDGRDTIALMSQNNFNVGLRSADVLRIDGAIVAQNGRAGRNFYNSNCGATTGYIRSSLTLYGMLATNLRYGFAWSGGSYSCPDGSMRSSGYCSRLLTYDAKLLYSPPPSFPLTTNQYQIISWDEI